MVKTSSKTKRVSDITEMLAQGWSRKQILQKITKNYKLSESSIDKEIKEAKKVVAERNRQAEDIRLRVTEQSTEEAIKQGLKSDLELELILSQIASGNLEVEAWIKGEAVLRGVTPMESIAAIDKIYKKRGAYAPEKKELTGANGEPLQKQSVDLSKVPLETLLELAKHLDNS